MNPRTGPRSAGRWRNCWIPSACSTPGQNPRPRPRHAPGLAELEKIIRICGAHLLRSFGSNGFIPTYAAFNLIGDPDVRGREFLMAMTGLNSRGYKNSTLLFNLARTFIARSPAGDLINPPWTRDRRADVAADADPSSLGLLRCIFYRSVIKLHRNRSPIHAAETASSRRAISEMVEFCLGTSREDVRTLDGSTVGVITALAPLPHPRFSRFFAQGTEAGPRLRYLRAGLRHHRLLIFSGDAGRSAPIQC